MSIQPDTVDQNDEDVKVSAEDKLAYKLLSKKDKAHIDAEEQFIDEFELQARPCVPPPASNLCRSS